MTVVTLDQLVSKYNRQNLSVGKAVITCQNHAAVLKRFTKIVGETLPITELDADILEDYRLELRNLGLSSVSINTNLRSVKALLRWAEKRGYLERCPAVEFVKERKQAPKPALSSEEFQLLLVAAEKEYTLLLRFRAKAILNLLYDTGLRAGELCRARYADIKHLQIDGQAAYSLEIYASKTDEFRPVVFRDRTWQTIKEYREELARPHGRGYKKLGVNPETIFVSTTSFEPLTVSGLRRMLFRLEARCEIHANPHKFRRTFADRYLNASEGEDSGQLEELGGWSDNRIIRKHYARYRLTALVRAYRRNLGM
jgi:integrase